MRFTFDIGCSGGGFSAHAARGDEDGAAASSLAASADATAQESATSALLVETRRTESGAWQVSVRRATAADGLDPAATGISIERDLASGDRERLGQVMAGESQTMLGICSLRERGRVAIPAGYRLERVLARVRHLAQDYALSSANHSRLGPLGGDFVARGGSVELLDGDVAELTYARSDGESESGSPWFLVVAREEVRTPAPTSRRPGLGERLPERFALHPNEPNPAVGSTRIRFDLPVTSAVKLEVFDLLGRKVVTLEHGQYPAGTHTSQWDLRDATGTMVRPGVYAYRLVAGPFRAHRKIGVRP